MRIDGDLVGPTLVSGAAAGIATTVTALMAGKREAGSYASLKFTGMGLLFKSAAAMFWAGLYEKWFAPRIGKSLQRSALRPLVGAAAVTAGAYITDYYLVPKRLTPGFEKRVSGKALATIYGALALGFLVGRAINERRQA